MNDALLAFAALGMPLGITIGYFGRRWVDKPGPPTDSQIAKYLGRIVNIEELESHQRLVRARMMRNKQSTLRFDGGPNAKVSKMRVRRGTFGKGGE